MISSIIRAAMRRKPCPSSELIIRGWYETVHIDGKRLRGAGRDGTVHHLVEALCGSRGIGLVETGAGAEGPAIQELVGDLDLAGRLVTLDAAGTTPAVAAAVRSRGADFLLAVEPNQRSLLDAMRPAFDQTAGPAHTTKDRGHGRHETRRARTSPIPRSSPGCPPRRGSPASAA